MAVVDDSGDVGLHHRAAQRLVVGLLADRRPHQVRAGEEDRAGALDDVRLVGHDRQVGAAGDAGAHDRRHLEDALGGQPGVVVEDAAVVLLVGEDLVLHRQEDARPNPPGRRSAAGSRAPSPAARSTFLMPSGNLAPALTVASSATTRKSRPWIVPMPGHHAGRRRAAVLRVHPAGRPQAELEEGRARDRTAPPRARAPSSCPAGAAAPAPSRRRRRGGAPLPRAAAPAPRASARRGDGRRRRPGARWSGWTRRADSMRRLSLRGMGGQRRPPRVFNLVGAPHRFSAARDGRRHR